MSLISFGIAVNKVFGTKKRLKLFILLDDCDGKMAPADVQDYCSLTWDLEVKLYDCEYLILMWKIARNK